MSDDSGLGRTLLGILALLVAGVAYLFWPLISNTPEHQAEVAIDEAVSACGRRGYYFYQRVWEAQKIIKKLDANKQPKLERELDQRVTKAGCSLKTPEEEMREDQDHWQKKHGSGTMPDMNGDDSTENPSGSPSDNSGSGSSDSQP